MLASEKIAIHVNIQSTQTRLLSVDHPRMRAFSYVWSLPVTWQRWRSQHSICHSWKHYTIRNLHVSVFYYRAACNADAV